MIFFSGSEIIEVAIQIEKNGFSFYKSIADSLDEGDVKNLFIYLATEEEIHIKSFESLYEVFKDYSPDIKDKEEYYDYINMLAGMNVFTRKEGVDKVLKGIKDRNNALDVAIKFEKESIIFFAEIKSMVRKSEKDAVEKLIRQEQEHLRRLFLLKKQ